MNEHCWLIGISGYARSGKDTVTKMVVEEFSKRGCFAPVAFAFANPLKEMVSDFLLKNFQISAFTQKDEEKAIIRPVLVGVGESKRNENPRHWIEQLEPRIVNLRKRCAEMGQDLGSVVSDVRYTNEAEWIKDLGGKVLHVNREGVEPPNEEEAKNTPLVAAMADYTIDWPTFENKDDIETEGRKLVIEAVEALLGPK